jgi:hypothetical protein
MAVFLLKILQPQKISFLGQHALVTSLKRKTRLRFPMSVGQRLSGTCFVALSDESFHEIRGPHNCACAQYVKRLWGQTLLFNAKNYSHRWVQLLSINLTTKVLIPIYSHARSKTIFFESPCGIKRFVGFYEYDLAYFKLLAQYQSTRIILRGRIVDLNPSSETDLPPIVRTLNKPRPLPPTLLLVQIILLLFIWCLKLTQCYKINNWRRSVAIF